MRRFRLPASALHLRPGSRSGTDRPQLHETPGCPNRRCGSRREALRRRRSGVSGVLSRCEALASDRKRRRRVARSLHDSIAAGRGRRAIDQAHANRLKRSIDDVGQAKGTVARRRCDAAASKGAVIHDIETRAQVRGESDRKARQGLVSTAGAAQLPVTDPGRLAIVPATGGGRSSSTSPTRAS